MDEQIFDALIEEFYLESCERIQRIEQALLRIKDSSPDEWEVPLVEAKRELHTIKGNAGMMGLRELQERTHGLEDRVAEFDDPSTIGELLRGVDDLQKILDRDGRPAGHEPARESRDDMEGLGLYTTTQTGVRVSFSALDSLVDLLSEMVIFRNRMAESVTSALASLDSGSRGAPVWRDLAEAHEILDKTLDRVQASVMKLRLVPLESLLQQQRRLVFDEAEVEGKEITVTLSGGETPIDKGLLEVASDALGHLVRNAVVHGLETPEERRVAGKRAKGHLAIRARAGSEEVFIEIEDDGRGVDVAKLRERARSQGHEETDKLDLPSLLALPGLSTRDLADASAGRGMGMAAVVDSIRRAGGQLEVESTPGVGTRFSLRLPLSVAIVRALLVEVDGDVYAIPASAVREAVTLRPGDPGELNGSAVLRWRGQLVLLVDLGVEFGSAQRLRNRGQVLFIESEGRYRGLVADSIVGLRDIVVKGLDRIIGAPRGLSGCTILGDGSVVLILDAPSLTLQVQRWSTAASGTDGAEKEEPSS